MAADMRFVGDIFNTNSERVAKAVDGVGPESWMRKPDDSSNHLMWIMGHMIWCRGNILRTLGTDWRLSWAKQFGRGSKPDEITDYPTVEEVLKAWHETGQQLAATLAQAPAEVLEKPHDKPTFDGNVSGFVAFLAYHETYHAGQIGFLKKWLGHGQMVG